MQDSVTCSVKFPSASAEITCRWEPACCNTCQESAPARAAGICGILGSTYTGEYEDIKTMDAELEKARLSLLWFRVCPFCFAPHISTLLARWPDTPQEACPAKHGCFLQASARLQQP